MAGSAAIKAAYRRGIIHRARPMAGRAALASPMSGLARLRGVRILRIVSATDILIGAAVPAMDRSEEHTSELQSLMRISYAVFCLKKKIRQYIPNMMINNNTQI